MEHEDAKLIEPTPELKAELLEMALEYRASGDDRYFDAIEDVDGFIRRLIEYGQGLNLKPGHVPVSFYWLVRGRRIIGRSGMRHRLSPSLEIEGGHIGYDIRPSERRKGYGTLILKLMLEKAREFGLSRVLVTCDTDNVASARIIEKNGGIFSGEGTSELTGKPVSRYWITL